ncbi:MAG: SRPBCC family protein [Propionibacteriaceae bacterium]|nr:SRPBCC family protein [Propionibacteriaceae bacterium]
MTATDSISVSRRIDASAKDIFAVLTLPSRHAEIDGSGFIRSVDHGDRIQETGTTFTMNMEGPHMGGEYQTDNVVSAYSENQMVGWKTAPAGQEPPGWEWLWELKADGSDATDVTLTYDWSKVTDQKLLDKLHFPLVKEEELEQSLANLASAVSN